MRKVIIFFFFYLSISTVIAATYNVGPTKEYKILQDVAKLLQPGDIVYVEGNAEYPGSVKFENHGTKVKPIRIIGVKVAGQKPVIKSETKDVVVTFFGDNYIFDNFEIVGNMQEASDPKLITRRGLYQVADGITIRHCSVHDSANGIMGSDLFSGSLTIEYCDIYYNGAFVGDHNIYIASDRVRHPDVVTKVRFNYIHDSYQGAGLKSRTSRNEVYYNWFENNYSSEADFFGADLGPGTHPIYNDKGEVIGYTDDNHTTQDELRKIDKSYGENYVREDTDFVGNVVVNENKVKSLTIGGDGGSGGPTRNGTSFGRYRFVNNTFINTAPVDGAGRSYVGQLKFGIGSLEFDNNIVYNKNGINIVFYFNPYDLNNDIHQTNSDLRWSADRQFIGHNNWFKIGTKISEGITDSILGEVPDFVSLVDKDFHLRPESHLKISGSQYNSNIFSTAIYYTNIGGVLKMDVEFIEPLMYPYYQAPDPRHYDESTFDQVNIAIGVYS
ncbi:right-handed parallel beta-helix repeat-containing protein [Francisella salina]|uniref:Right handed beta helix domain-containing protein n=1 Tax=Francisella salina TaxID=573569 RepID=A0ABN3ZMU4_FRAST|nr:hypothetical protein [Francisella salina]AEI36667.1 hypothetical protein F7308_1743 [Francisella salina]